MNIITIKICRQYSISSIAKGDFVYVLGGLIGIVETLTYLIIK